MGRILRRASASRFIGYALAAAGPVTITTGLVDFHLAPSVLEHLSLLLVVAIAVRWGIGPAIVAATVSVTGDIVLREPFASPPASGIHDATHVLLFATVAATIGWLVSAVQHERTRAEEAARREMQAREERDRLIATVSHDLATPLAAISGTVQFAQRFGGARGLDMSRLLARLQTASARATSLLKGLQDARAIERGGLEMKLEPLDLRQVVAPIVQMLDHVSDRHPIALAMTDVPIPIDGDAERLHRAIENILSNAIKYSPQGGGIEVSVVAAGDAAIVTVRDHGIGVSPEALPRIFRPSFRSPEAIETAAGLGLGLSIATEIVRRHGGEITAWNSNPGLTVSLRLPLSRIGARSSRYTRAEDPAVLMEPR